MGHEQTLILLKIQVEMIGNYTFKGKMANFCHTLKKMPANKGTNRCVDLTQPPFTFLTITYCSHFVR